MGEEKQGRNVRERERERSSAYHHSTDVQTKCVGLSVSSLRLSGKLQRWPVSIDQVNQLQLKKKHLYSGCNLLRWQRWKEPEDQDENLELPKAFGQTEEVHFPSRSSKGTVSEDSDGAE